jgi:hypothetical protein
MADCRLVVVSIFGVDASIGVRYIRCVMKTCLPGVVVGQGFFRWIAGLNILVIVL